MPEASTADRAEAHVNSLDVPDRLQTFLALDFGSRRTGVAFGTRLLSTARPLATIHAASAATRLLQVHSRVQEWQPDALVVALLRDPVERAFSHWKERRNHTEDLPFEAALAAESERTDGEEARLMADPSAVSMAHRHQSYVAQGRYAPMLERWLGAYGPDQVIVEAAETFYADPQAFLDRLTDRLGLPRRDLGTPQPFNAEPSADMDSQVRAVLTERLGPDIEAVEQLLGRPLPWPR